MERPGRILVLDDQKAWRELLSETLKEGGFLVDCVDSKAAALTMMDKTFYHLLIVDVNLDDSDEDNKEGLEFLIDLDQRGFSSGLKVIILSAYGTMELMREAFTRYKVVDFLQKDNQFFYDDFLEEVKRLFKSALHINLDLKIEWNNTGLEDLVENLSIDGVRVKSGTPLGDLAAAELEDLLCRLFHKATELMINPLDPGRSGASVLWAKPYYPRSGRSVVVKFGDRKKIDGEFDNFDEYVKSYIGGGRNTSIPNEGRRITTRLGGIIYNFLGTDYDKLDSFGNYYRNSTANDIVTVIRRLFDRTCSSWYADKSFSKPLDLTKSYRESLGFATEKLPDELEKLRKHVEGGATLKFKALDERSFTNPLFELHKRTFKASTYVTITHGDFNETNILVDRDRYSWLIDFGRTGEGHILRDVAQLDSIVRLRLIEPDAATLEERLKLEDGLMKVSHFKKLHSQEFNFGPGSEDRVAQYLGTHNIHVYKAFVVTLALRKIAGGYVPPPNEDMSEYYVALLYYALNSLRFPVPSNQKLHALLSASLLTDRLAAKRNPYAHTSSLYD